MVDHENNTGLKVKPTLPIEFPGNAQPTGHCSPRAGKVPAPVSIQEMVDLEQPQQRSKWGTWALRMSCPWKISRKQTHEHELPMMIVLVKVKDCFFGLLLLTCGFLFWDSSSFPPQFHSHPGHLASSTCKLWLSPQTFCSSFARSSKRRRTTALCDQIRTLPISIHDPYNERLQSFLAWYVSPYVSQYHAIWKLQKKIQRNIHSKSVNLHSWQTTMFRLKHTV